MFIEHASDVSPVFFSFLAVILFCLYVDSFCMSALVENENLFAI